MVKEMSAIEELEKNPEGWTIGKLIQAIGELKQRIEWLEEDTHSPEDTE